MIDHHNYHIYIFLNVYECMRKTFSVMKPRLVENMEYIQCHWNSRIVHTSSFKSIGCMEVTRC